MKTVKGIIAATFFSLNTIILVSLLLCFALIKFLIPVKPFRVFVSKILVWIAESWIWNNSKIIEILHGEVVVVENLPEFDSKQWYLVVANHQSMVDIPILQTVFNRKIPFLKFFIKQELIWVPLLGLAWWALDFPFMKRFSKEVINKKPHLKGKDMEQTKKSCEKFKDFPTSVINFIEGTRFTPSKHDKQKSPYQYLLKPKAGGIGFVMEAMGQQMNTLLLVTLIYPKKAPGVWDYLCGNFEKVSVFCEKIVIPETLLNKNYQNDEKFRTELFKWCENLWYKQDKKLMEFYERSNI